ncbi:hypothetical protein Dxin01_01574 [Deinococcus xinjiangensis]|uniref:DinB-like domain-containing protein n=1 Tax=Deinococcus xinjiangensis TaxID=457454 RepID=A0ABP9VBC2_9DEIO
MPELAQVITEHLPYLQDLTEEQAARKPTPDVWSAKEILGHLIDSGVNNHARFVLSSVQDDLHLSGYNQNDWVSVGAWQERHWADLVALWATYQGQLAHIIAHLPPASLAHSLRIGESERLTLSFVAEDYVRHQLHHLAQIRERAGV